MDRAVLLVVSLFFCVFQVSFCQKTTSSPLTKKSKDQRDCEVLTRPCSGGMPGIPGANGMPGMPGPHGARGDQGGPGTKGEKGDQGDQGLQGVKGNSGLKGLQGDKGDRGAIGLKGTKGDRGSRGQAGSPGKNGASGPKGDRGSSGAKGNAGQKGDAAAVGPIFPANWKQCVWKAGDGKDSGKIKECSFNKFQGNTALKVSFQGNMRVDGSNKCNRWYFKFNGNECSGPMTIEAMVFNYWPSGNPRLHHHRSFEGYCENMPRGVTTVELWVGSCTGQTQGDAHTGWNSVSRIMVEEVPRSQ